MLKSFTEESNVCHLLYWLTFQLASPHGEFVSNAAETILEACFDVMIRGDVVSVKTNHSRVNGNIINQFNYLFRNMHIIYLDLIFFPFDYNSNARDYVRGEV